MKKSGLFLLAIILSACTAKYDVLRHDNQQLSMSDSYFIAKPDNGKYGTIDYVNSGEMTQNALFNELKRLNIKVEKEKHTQEKQISLINARDKGFDILIFPTILHWEDRATEWSGLRDRAKINLELISTQSEQTIDNALLDLVGTWWTFGGLHPQDMVNEAVENYFQKLFGLEQ